MSCLGRNIEAPERETSAPFFPSHRDRGSPVKMDSPSVWGLHEESSTKPYRAYSSSEKQTFVVLSH